MRRPSASWARSSRGRRNRDARLGFPKTLCVQQPCSNPSKSSEMLGKVSTQKDGYLREFCNLLKPLAKYRTAFTRQRSLVPTQHRPLYKLRGRLLVARDKGSAERPLVGDVSGGAAQGDFGSLRRGIPKAEKNPRPLDVRVRSALPVARRTSESTPF